MTSTTRIPAAPIILVTTAHPTLHQHPGRHGEPVHPRLGRLLQPRHLSSVELTGAAGIPWAADNDCFQGLDERAYRKMLDRLEGVPGCLFVTVPDTVGDAAATLESFDAWAPELEARGFPLGLVAQDGMTLADLDARAPRLAALFIGGSTEWKEGPEAAELAIAAKAAGLWVHWGRVNTRRRFDLIVATGAADSFDGSKWARFRKTYLPGGLDWLDEAAAARRAAIAELGDAQRLERAQAAELEQRAGAAAILAEAEAAGFVREPSLGEAIYVEYLLEDAAEALDYLVSNRPQEPHPMTSTTPEAPRDRVAEVRIATAELEVLDRYDLLRGGAGHDYGNGQRASELMRRRHALELARSLAGIRASDGDLAEPTSAELLDAALRLLQPRLNRARAEAAPWIADADGGRYDRMTPSKRRTIDALDRVLRHYAEAHARAGRELEGAGR